MNEYVDYINWQGPGWYASRQMADGTDNTICVGYDDTRKGRKEAEDDAYSKEYGSVTWYDVPPSGEDVIVL